MEHIANKSIHWTEKRRNICQNLTDKRRNICQNSRVVLEKAMEIQINADD